MNAQKLIDTCEKHGVIHWKQLRELVNKDRCECARKGEYIKIKRKEFYNAL